MFRAVESSITRPCWRRSSGTKATPASIAAAGLPRRSLRPATRTAPASVAVDPEDRPRHLAAPCPDEPRERDDLARANLERDVEEHALSREPIDLKHRRAGRVLLVLTGRDVASDHRAHQLVDGDSGELLREHALAVTQQP